MSMTVKKRFKISNGIGRIGRDATKLEAYISPISEIVTLKKIKGNDPILAETIYSLIEEKNMRKLIEKYQLSAIKPFLVQSFSVENGVEYIIEEFNSASKAKTQKRILTTRIDKANHVERIEMGDHTLNLTIQEIVELGVYTKILKNYRDGGVAIMTNGKFEGYIHKPSIIIPKLF